MKSIDYIFIFFCTLSICVILVSIIYPLIPKDLMMESKVINIKRGKIIGSIIGFSTVIFISYYLIINGYFFK